MKILLSCSGGMSSSLIAESLQDAGKKRGLDLSVKATGTEEVADDLNADHYDIVLLAPQAVYRKSAVQAASNDANVKFMMIPRDCYNPIASNKLLNLVEKELQ